MVPIGESLGEDWQSAFVIPAYLQEQYPDLDSIEDLKEDRFKELFATCGDGRQGAPSVLHHRLGVRGGQRPADRIVRAVRPRARH